MAEWPGPAYQLWQVDGSSSHLTAGLGLRVCRQQGKSPAGPLLLQAGWDISPGPRVMGAMPECLAGAVWEEGLL